MSVHRTNRRRARRAETRGAAFYDLDGTLADLNLVHITLYVLSNVGEWSGRIARLLGFAGRIPRIYLAERHDRRLLNLAIFEAFKGISRDRLVVLGEEYCERILMPRLYPQALEVLERNREAGLEPVLVTGSPDFLVAALARRLGVESFAANQLVFSRGLATGRLREPVMAGSEKAAWCAGYAAGHGVDLARSWGYADSYYDLPFLAALGHPVAVNPDRRLEAAAVGRQWPIVRFEKSAGAKEAEPPADAAEPEPKPLPLEAHEPARRSAGESS